MPRPPKYAARRDSNEEPIVAALRQLGASVVYLNIPDAPDLLAGFRGEVTWLIEVKTPTGKLRPGQINWHENWNGTPVQIIRSVDDAINLVNNYANLRLQMQTVRDEKRSPAVLQGRAVGEVYFMRWAASAPDYYSTSY